MNVSDARIIRANFLTEISNSSTISCVDKMYGDFQVVSGRLFDRRDGTVVSGQVMTLLFLADIVTSNNSLSGWL